MCCWTVYADCTLNGLNNIIKWIDNRSHIRPAWQNRKTIAVWIMWESVSQTSPQSLEQPWGWETCSQIKAMMQALNLVSGICHYRWWRNVIPLIFFFLIGQIIKNQPLTPCLWVIFHENHKKEHMTWKNECVHMSELNCGDDCENGKGVDSKRF